MYINTLLDSGPKTTFGIGLWIPKTTNAWNRHPNSKYEIYYLEFQIRIRNSKYIFGIPNTVFGIPNTLFRIPNTYLEFQIPYSEFQIRIWNSIYVFRIPNTVFGISNRVFGILNRVFGIPNTVFVIPNTYLEFQIAYFIFWIWMAVPGFRIKLIKKLCTSETSWNR